MITIEGPAVGVFFLLLVFLWTLLTYLVTYLGALHALKRHTVWLGEGGKERALDRRTERRVQREAEYRKYGAQS